MASLLDNKGFRRLWISQIALALGDAVMQMGLLEYFRAHGYSERTETAKMFFAVALPGLLLGVAVGAVAVIVPLWLGVRAFERLEA